MDDTVRGDHAWQLAGSNAELGSGRFSARVDVSRPDVGLQRIALDRQPLDARLLCLAGDAKEPICPWQVADAYVRGSDLVATYSPRDNWPFLTQIYWQADTSRPSRELLASLSLFISVQTDLLDTWPRIHIQSHVAAEDALWIEPDAADTYTMPLSLGHHALRASRGPACVLRRIAGLEFSYAEIMPASDFREIHIAREANGASGTRWDLFGDFLEKGVIWRACLHSIWLPRAGDVELVREFCQALEQRPLPLTT